MQQQAFWCSTNTTLYMTKRVVFILNYFVISMCVCLIPQLQYAKHLVKWPTAEAHGILKITQNMEKIYITSVMKDTPSLGKILLCAAKLVNMILSLPNAKVSQSMCLTCYFKVYFLHRWEADWDGQSLKHTKCCLAYLKTTHALLFWTCYNSLYIFQATQ